MTASWCYIVHMTVYANEYENVGQSQVFLQLQPPVGVSTGFRESWPSAAALVQID